MEEEHILLHDINRSAGVKRKRKALWSCLCCAKCIRKISCKIDGIRRPTWAPIHCPLIILIIGGFCFAFPGLFALPDYFNGDSVNGTVIGYNTKPEYCIWITYAVLSYTVNNTTYTKDRLLAYSACGDYQAYSLYNAQAKYPLQSNVSLWYYYANHATVAKSNPLPLVLLMLLFSSLIVIALLFYVLHFFSVWCCGCETWCMREKHTLRLCDPFE